MKKKIYEVPALCVTELETEDIMAASDLLGWDLVQSGDILGSGEIEFDLISIEKDLQ